MYQDRTSRQGPGLGVVLSHPGQVVLQRVLCGGRQQPCLAHPATHGLADVACSGRKLGAANQHGADWGAQALAQADCHRVAAVAIIKCDYFVSKKYASSVLTPRLVPLRQHQAL